MYLLLEKDSPADHRGGKRERTREEREMSPSHPNYFKLMLLQHAWQPHFVDAVEHVVGATSTGYATWAQRAFEATMQAVLCKCKTDIIKARSASGNMPPCLINDLHRFDTTSAQCAELAALGMARVLVFAMT